MPSLPNKHHSSRSRRTYRTIIFTLVWLVLLGLIANKNQSLLDWWRLANYQPPAAVAALATEDGFTPSAKRLFYINQPNITPKQNFSGFCPNNGGEQTIVLGCYHSNQAGIYLLSVSDPRLNGVMPVTAAHEMLHAAYDRLSPSDKNYIDNLLTNYFKHDLSDPRIISTMAAYTKSEPGDVVNEMHSVFGTEIANLPPPLENYYKRYFTNRHQITGYAAAYQAEFTSRQATISQDDKQLGSWKSQIDNLESELSQEDQTINSESNQLSADKSASNFAAYNTLVPQYNALVQTYNVKVTELKGLIDRYNNLVSQRNSVALEEDQLTRELSPTSQAIKP